MTRKLKWHAKQFGYGSRKWEQTYLKPFREPHPQISERERRIQISDGRSREEVLASLVSVAVQQGFPVASDDMEAMQQWLQRIVRASIWPEASDADSKEVANRVLHALFIRYDLPAISWTLQAYIKAEACGVVKTIARERAKPGAPLGLSPEAAEAMLRKNPARKGGERAVDSDSKLHYSVDELVSLLELESKEDKWTPRRDTLYDWINKGHRWCGKPDSSSSRRNRLRVTQWGLSQIRRIVRYENCYKTLHAAVEACMSSEAVKKTVSAQKNSERDAGLGSPRNAHQKTSSQN